MAIPTDLQARINEIQARFAAPAATSTRAPTTGSSATDAGAFASVLAQQLAGSSGSVLGTGGASLSLDGVDAGGLSTAALRSSLASAGLTDAAHTYDATRTAAAYGNGWGTGAGFGGVGSAGAVGSVGESGRIATSGPIASKRTVANLEGMYENGRLPDEALTSIGVGNHRLSPPAASAFVRMRAAAAADGVTIGVTDSYRSYDAQVDVARRKGLYSQGGLAAKPGTSDHGLGLALDLDLDPAALGWMRAKGARYGFVEDTPRESWHWKLDGI